jgi:hypothetical protein
VVPGPWSIISSPNTPPGTSPSDQLEGVSCLSASFCFSVGGSYGIGPERTLIEQWNGSTWSIVPSPNTSPSIGSYLVAVSCVTATFCMAVGNSDGPGSQRTLTEQWNGSTWSIVPSPNSSPTIINELRAVSCASASFCVAVGESFATPGRTLALQWNGSVWTIAVTADASPVNYDYLSGVSCKSASFCVAVGAASDGFSPQTLVEQWNGSSWSIVPSPSPSAHQTSGLQAVSCPGASYCVAVGTQNPGPHNVSLVEQWNGSAWSIVPSPSAPGTLGDELDGVSCVGPTSCVAVGSTSTTGIPDFNTISLALTWNGSVWALDPPVNPAVTPVGNDFVDLVGVSCVGGQSCTTAGGAFPGTGVRQQTLVETAPITRPGYRFVASDGGLFAFGGAGFNGSHGGQALNKPMVGMAATPDGGGYWLVASDGGVFSYGDAVFYGSTGGMTLNKPIVGMASTPDGGGYWLVASDGGVFSFGDANFFGSTGGIALNKPIVGMAASPSGQGYWLVASDGGVFSFGDAHFHGSTGGITLNKPVVGMAASPSGQGYWLVASDGGVFSFGDALFHGSAGAITLNKPVVGMAASPSGQGYWLVASDGGIFSYGDALFHGSTGAITLNKPIVGMSA